MTKKQKVMEKTVIELLIDMEDLEGYKISLVDEPANESYFLAFQANKTKMMFAADEDKHIITGAVLIPQMKIYRRDERGEYYVFFNDETVKKIAYAFLSDGKVNDFNLNHSTETQGVKIIESFISTTDGERGIDAPAGSWLISAKVDDEKIWKAIKDGKFNGFSLEGTFFYDVVNEDEKIIKEAEALCKA